MGLVDENDLVGMMRMLDSIFGRAAYLALRNKVAEDGLDSEESDSARRGAAQIGLRGVRNDDGESQASPGS